MKSYHFTLLYFSGCPHADAAKRAAAEAGISYDDVDQETLSGGDPLAGFTSPTLLMNGKVVFGAYTTEGAKGCTLDIPKAEEIIRRIQEMEPDADASFFPY